MPLINYPDVCTASCCYGKAFCEEHCRVVEEAGYPSDLRAFLKVCISKERTGIDYCLKIYQYRYAGRIIRSDNTLLCTVLVQSFKKQCQ
jgi:hypothetical protein